jgi:hypothetical protein
MPETIRIAVVGDIHHGPATRTKRGDQALPLLEKVVREIERERPDLVVDMGDRISDVDPQTDRRLMREVGGAFAGLGVPRVHLLGNHDMHFIDRAANEEALGCALAHEVRDLGLWRLIVFQPTVEIRRPSGFAPIAQADLEWLAAALGQDERPALVTSHVPVSGQAMTGNFYFENNPQYATYPNIAAIRDLLRRAVAPVAWLSGHVHWNTLAHVDGVPHMTVQSLTESFTTGGEAAGSHGMLTLSAPGLELVVHGNDPFAVRLPVPRKGPDRWRRPTRPFDPAA